MQEGSLKEVWWIERGTNIDKMFQLMIQDENFEMPKNNMNKKIFFSKR